MPIYSSFQEVLVEYEAITSLPESEEKNEKVEAFCLDLENYPEYYKTLESLLSLIESVGFEKAVATTIQVSQENSEIKNFFSHKGQNVLDIIPKREGIHPGCEVELESGQRFYVKTHENYPSKIDPREFLVYKSLEFSGFGPKIEFIPIVNIREQNPTYYLASLDVSFSNKKIDKKFTKAITLEEKEKWRNALTDNEHFAIEYMVLDKLGYIFSLSDTFSNIGNYGLTESRKKEASEASREDSSLPDKKPRMEFIVKKPKLIDFRISKDSRDSDKFELQLEEERKTLIGQKAIKMMQEGKTKFYKKEHGTKIQMGIAESIEEASKYVFEMIRNNKEFFVEKAEEKLQEFKSSSLARFQQIMANRDIETSRT